MVGQSGSLVSAALSRSWFHDVLEKSVDLECALFSPRFRRDCLPQVRVHCSLLFFVKFCEHMCVWFFNALLSQGPQQAAVPNRAC